MKIIEDLHVHTKYSKDSKEEPINYVNLALERGLKFLGFSDHIDLDPADKDYRYFNFELAYENYCRLKDVYGSKLEILFGSEITYQSFLNTVIEEEMQDKPYDYIIGSVHRLMGYTVSGPHGVDYFKGKDEYTAYMIYFEELLKIVEVGSFDVVGHFDVIKRYGKDFYGEFKIDKYEPIIKEILKKVIDKEMVIEINTSSFRQGFFEPYPSREIIELYAALGGKEIVLGSDAHSVKHFNMFLDNGVNILKSIFDFEVVSYNMRKKVRVSKISELFREDAYG
ncbi:MAG: histidinol-phosphatase HisJ family protein [Caldisericaceae bacterium]